MNARLNARSAQAWAFVGARLHAMATWCLHRSAPPPTGQQPAVDAPGYRGSIRTEIKIGFSGAHVLVLLQMPGGVMTILPFTPAQARARAAELRDAADHVDNILRALAQPPASGRVS